MIGPSVRPLYDVEGDGMSGAREEGVVVDVQEEALELENQEVHKQRGRRKPEEPTQEEIEEHYLDHANYREWCPHCVKGKGVSHPHRKIDEDEKGVIPVVSMEYMFLSDKQDKGEEKGMPILVTKDHKTRMVFARVVPRKGADTYAIKRARQDLHLLGHKRMILRTDPEASILALVNAAKMEAEEDIIPERVAVGDH